MAGAVTSKLGLISSNVDGSKCCLNTGRAEELGMAAARAPDAAERARERSGRRAGGRRGQQRRAPAAARGRGGAGGPADGLRPVREEGPCAAAGRGRRRLAGQSRKRRARGRMHVVGRAERRRMRPPCPTCERRARTRVTFTSRGMRLPQASLLTCRVLEQDSHVRGCHEMCLRGQSTGDMIQMTCPQAAGVAACGIVGTGTGRDETRAARSSCAATRYVRVC